MQHNMRPNQNLERGSVETRHVRYIRTPSILPQRFFGSAKVSPFSPLAALPLPATAAIQHEPGHVRVLAEVVSVRTQALPASWLQARGRVRAGNPANKSTARCRRKADLPRQSGKPEGGGGQSASEYRAGAVPAQFAQQPLKKLLRNRSSGGGTEYRESVLLFILKLFEQRLKASARGIHGVLSLHTTPPGPLSNTEQARFCVCTLRAVASYTREISNRPPRYSLYEMHA